MSQNLARLIDDKTMARAHILSSAFRLAYLLTAAMPGLLPKIGLKLASNRELVMSIPRKFSDLMGERVDKRFAALAAEFGRTSRIEID